ncbi:extracellular solute-binding protein [Halonotius terrestris]|uniref:Extracellular solute-binding protein n=1 Tax=Halonotius terrestris TaxID=2487750 RepID=A0A8J8PBW1_9EURY|nr:extracellular solute-binding protein [Halonotius terrestris]TQQ80983.1 extracellular solute-binding protein [Halonotius terrestris]
MRIPAATVSRRAAIGALGASVLGGVAGCLGETATAVSLLSAGSLARTFEDHVGPAFEAATDYRLHGEYYGSNAVMRRVESETARPDVITSADATLLRDRLYGSVTDWDVSFATNSLGLAYDASTDLGSRLADGVPWYEVAADSAPGEIAISDPDLDPLGYRAVMAFDLAAAEHGLAEFRETMLQRVYQEPAEPQLLAGIESGDRAAAIVYHNMAVEHDLPFIEFPPAYDFGSPTAADQYATVSYTTDDGYTASGRPVIYNATVHADARNPTAGRRLVQFLLDNPDLLTDAGLSVGSSLPRAHGSPPEGIIV